MVFFGASVIQSDSDFLPASLFGLVGYRAAGLWTAQVTRYCLLSLPAIGLGQAIDRRLGAGRFLLYVPAGPIVSGVVPVPGGTGPHKSLVLTARRP